MIDYTYWMQSIVAVAVAVVVIIFVSHLFTLLNVHFNCIVLAICFCCFLLTISFSIDVLVFADIKNIGL